MIGRDNPKTPIEELALRFAVYTQAEDEDWDPFDIPRNDPTTAGESGNMLAQLLRLTGSPQATEEAILKARATLKMFY